MKRESIVGLLNAVSAYILEIDEKDQILWANDAASELEPELLQRPVTEAFPFLPEVPSDGKRRISYKRPCTGRMRFSGA